VVRWGCDELLEEPNGDVGEGKGRGAEEVSGGERWKGRWMLRKAATAWTGPECWAWSRK